MTFSLGRPIEVYYAVLPSDFIGQPRTRRSLIRGLLTAIASGSSLARDGAKDSGLKTSDFSDLKSALESWAKIGGTLVVDRDYDFDAPVTVVVLPGLSYLLKADGARTLRYAGPPYHWALSIYSEGKTPVRIEGGLTIDGANRVCIPFYAKFDKADGDLRRDFVVDGLTCRNARMAPVTSPIDGSRVNLYGASGMLFAGGFDHLHLRNVAVDNVTRAAGAGTPFFQGCVGIGVVAKLGGKTSARHVLIEDFVVTRVDSEDSVNSDRRVDMDGVLVFQSEESDGTRPLIQRGVIREAAGRAVKVFAPGGGGTTCQLRIYRSIPSSFQGAVEVDHQHGDGLISDIDISYSGRAHATPTTVIGMGSLGARKPGFPYAAGEIRNIRIRDRTGTPKSTLVSVYSSAVDPSSRVFMLTGISDDGTARNLLMTGALGTYGPARVVLDEIDIDLTVSVVVSDDPTQLLRIRARRSTFSRGRPVRTKARHDGTKVFSGRDIRVDLDRTVKGLDISAR